MSLQTCRRHPGPRFLRTCPGCAQELYDIEAANRAKAEFKALLATVTLPGPIHSITLAGAGAVVVCATPGGDWGEYEITSWRPRTEAETSQDQAEALPGETVPQIAYVAAQTVGTVDEIPAAAAAATAELTNRFAPLTA